MVQETAEQKANNLVIDFNKKDKVSKEEAKQKALNLSESVKGDLYKIYIDNVDGKFNYHFEDRVAYWENVVKNIKNS